MRRFRFRLETVLAARRTAERIEQEELARRRRDLLTETDRLEALRAAREQLTAEDTEGPIDVRERLLTDRFRVRLGGAIRRQTERVGRAEGAVDDSRRTLLVRAQEREAVEKLEERKREERRVESGRVEQKSLDEIAGRLVRDESGGVARTVIILVAVYLVLFIGVLKITGVLENQIIPRITGRSAAPAAAADSLAFPSAGIEAAIHEAETARRAAERDSLVSLSRRVEMKTRELGAEIRELIDLREQEAAAATPEPEEEGRATLADLAKVYGSMKPRELSPILAELDEEMLVGVMSKLKGRQLAAFLGALEPARAAALSARLVAPAGATDIYEEGDE
jgi:flagellar export protein FliJ